MRLRILAVLVIIAIASTACANQGPVVPVGGFAGLLGASGDEGFNVALQELSNSRATDALTECMLSEGFEWQRPDGFFSTTSRPGDPDGTLTDDEYAAGFGFGIAEAANASLPDLSTTSDPNASYLDSLSDGARSQLSLIHI